ncbi:potassium-transporting ATPase subunit KdpA [Streptomyces sp. NPDC054804]
MRFGVPGSTLFGIAATGSADGAANASYDSFSSLGGGVLLSAMMLGEIAPGGTGSGLYGLIMAVLIAVFVGGLMVGRTPEYLRKRIGFPEMRGRCSTSCPHCPSARWRRGSSRDSRTGPAIPHSHRPARPGPSRGGPAGQGGHCCRPSHRP